MSGSDHETKPWLIEDKAKPTEFEKTRLEDRAFAETIMSRSVGILTDAGQGVGTGTLVRYRDIRLILTARHVIAGSLPSSLRFAFRPPGSLHEAPLRAFAAGPTPLLGGQALKIIRIVEDIPYDIAAVILDDGQEIAAPAELYDANLIKVIEIPDRSTLQIAGFPSDNAIQVNQRTKAVGAVMDRAEFDAALNGRPDLSRYLSHKQFAFGYGWADDLEPRGFSGSAVWGGADSKSPIWTANITLVGVVTQYLRTEKLMCAAKLEGIVPLLTRLNS
jgi:hypothetical protein